MANTYPNGDNGADSPVSNRISGGVFFHAVIQGRDITVQLPRQITPALSGLPTATTAFTGRDEQVEELLEILAPDRERRQAVLVAAVAGLAGVGKTELVVQTAVRALGQSDWFPGGVLFVDMFGYDPGRQISPERALDGLLRALGMPADHIPAELQDRSRLYRSVLAAFAEQGRRILVIIDNVSTTEQARPLLPTDGTTAALLTSRHTLDIDARLHDLDSLNERASVELLGQVLLQARGLADTRVKDAPEHAATIARLCAGLPIALRIAAALLADAPTRPLASLAGALKAAHTRLDRLRRENRAVRAAFDLSYQHLSDAHARLFRLLPLHVGPDLSTESSAHLSGTAQPQTGELLQDLARAHLIESGLAWDRWRLHDLVRLYAVEHGDTHADADQRDAALVRLHDYYCTTALAAATDLDTLAGTPSSLFADRREALSWLDNERRNLVATAIAAPKLGQPDTSTTLHFALSKYLGLRRYLDDGVAVAIVALNVYRELGDRYGEATTLNSLGVTLQEMRHFDEAIKAHTDAQTIYRELDDHNREAGALNNLGLTLRQMNRFDEAIEVLTRAVTIHGECGDHSGEAQALNNLGTALQQVGQLDKAIDAHSQAATIHGEFGNHSGEARALNNLGNAMRTVHRFQEAIKAHNQAIDVFRKLDDRYNEAQALNSLGRTLHEVRRFDEAIDAHTQDATIRRQLGDRHNEARALNNLGTALQGACRFDAASDAHAQSVDIYRELDDRHSETIALNSVGLALQKAARFDQAVDAHTQSATAFHELGDRYGEALALNNLGAALRELRQFDKAIAAHIKARTIYREIEDRHGEPRALDNLALALREVARFEEAIAAHTEAIGVLHEFSDRHGEALALNNLGTTLRKAAQFDQAVDAHSQAATVYRELGDSHSEAWALDGLGDALREAQRFEEAIDVYTQDVAIRRQLGDRHNEARALNNLGIALQGACRFDAAIGAHAQSATAFGELADDRNEAVALNNLSIDLQKVRRFHEAIGVRRNASHAHPAGISHELGDYGGLFVDGPVVGDPSLVADLIEAVHGRLAQVSYYPAINGEIGLINS